MKKKIMILAVALLGITAIKAQCVATYNYNVSPANNGIVTFTPVSTFAGCNYFWSFGDGSSGTGAPVTHTYNTGIYTICCTATDSNGVNLCTFCDSIYVVNNSVSNCAAAFQVYIDSTGTAQFLDYSTGSNLTYFWSFGDNTTGNTSGNCSHNYNVSGYYQICLTVSNSSAGCSNTFCDSLYVPGAGSTSCSASFTSVNDTTGNGVTFTSTVTGTANIYDWNFGDGSAHSSSANPHHIYAASGTYYVCLYVYSSTDTTCYYSTCSNIYIGAPAGGCNANFIIIQDSMNLYNYWVYNYASGNGNSIATYLWDFGDGTQSTLPYPQHTYTGTGPYYICLTIATAGGGMLTCTATYCDSIFPGHSPNQNTTISVINPLTVGIQNQKEIVESLDNYPNPFTNTTTVSYTIKQNSPIELSVFDLLGNKITTIETASKSAGTYKTNFDASSIAAGIYMLQLKTDNKTTTKKLIITK